MAIANLEIIRIGNKNQAVNSDSLYDAFYKIKNNFANINNANVYTNYVGGTGISIAGNANTSTLTITNTGIIGVVAGTGIAVSNISGIVTITSNIGNSAITNVRIASNNLTVINSSSGSNANYTINLPNTGVANGSYSFANLTVDNTGRITAISNGVPGIASGLANGTSNVAIPVANGNVVISVGGIPSVLGISTTRVTSNANLTVQGDVNAFNVVANTAVINDDIALGNTLISWSTLTTTSTTTRSIAEVPINSNSTGVKFLVKSVDTAGSKYSLHSVMAVTNGTTANYVIYGNTFVGGSTGTLTVGVAGGNLHLRASPVSSNSTVWTTQYQVI